MVKSSKGCHIARLHVQVYFLKASKSTVFRNEYVCSCGATPPISDRTRWLPLAFTELFFCKCDDLSVHGHVIIVVVWFCGCVVNILKDILDVF